MRSITRLPSQVNEHDCFINLAIPICTSNDGRFLKKKSVAPVPVTSGSFLQHVLYFLKRQTFGLRYKIYDEKQRENGYAPKEQERHRGTDAFDEREEGLGYDKVGDPVGRCGDPPAQPPVF